MGKARSRHLVEYELPKKPIHLNWFTMGCELLVNVAGTNGAAAWLPLHGAIPPLTLVSGEEPLRCWCRPADMAVGA